MNRYLWLQSFWLGLLALTQLGCLGIISIEQEVPGQKNHPVNIKAGEYKPLDRDVVIEKTKNPTGFTLFTVFKAIDFDKEDVLYAYWFLNRHNQPISSFRCGGNPEPPLQKDFDFTKPREVNFECKITHGDDLIPGNVSILEVYIVDRRADIGDLIRDKNPIWPESSTVAERTWYLKVQ